MTDPSLLDAVLEVWLGPGEAPTDAQRAKWFRPDPAFDALLREQFLHAIERAARGELDAWQATPRGVLGLVLLLDQFSRNVFRGSPRAFAQDPKALEVARAAIARGDHEHVPGMGRSWLFMPFMHAEDLEAQDRCIELFEDAARTAPDELRGHYVSATDYARKHRAIIARFGRFPHRNEVLGRVSTPEEAEFLKEPGARF